MTDHEKLELSEAKALVTKHRFEEINARFAAEMGDLDAKWGWYFMARDDEKASMYREKMEALVIARRQASVAMRSAGAEYTARPYFADMHPAECTCTERDTLACPACKAQSASDEIPF